MLWFIYKEKEKMKTSMKDSRVQGVKGSRVVFHHFISLSKYPSLILLISNVNKQPHNGCLGFARAPHSGIFLKFNAPILPLAL